jgi:hypothetical protein
MSESALFPLPLFQIGIERDVQIEPNFGQGRFRLLGYRDGPDEFCLVPLHQFTLGWVVPHKDTIIELLNGLQQAPKRAICLDPSKAVPNAIFVCSAVQPMSI